MTTCTWWCAGRRASSWASWTSWTRPAADPRRVDLSGLSDEIRRRFDAKMAAREIALSSARRSIRSSANAIRALHRGDLEQAHRLMGQSHEAILDLLRRDLVQDSERILAAMDDIYDLLVSVDYPDAITGNLRRSTDVARGILEKTRGDLSLSLTQRNLREALDRHARNVVEG